MIKKIFSLAITICFAISSVSFNIYASEVEEIEEVEIEFIYNEETGEYEGVMPFASEYFASGGIGGTISGSKISFSYNVTCYDADYFTLRIEHQRSKNGTSSWSTYDYTDVSSTSFSKAGSFSSDYSSSYYHRGYITAKAYVNDKVVETKYYTSPVAK